MTEKGMKTHHQLHEPRTTMQRGNILTFSLETYLIDFLKQTNFSVSSLDIIVIFEIINTLQGRHYHQGNQGSCLG